MSINKMQLVELVAKEADTSKAEAKRVLDALIGIVENALAQGDKVSITGFGAFEVRTRSARKGRNPQTGEEIEIAGGNYPAFRPSRVLKEKVQGA